MRLHLSPIHIQISSEKIAQARAFAKAVAQTTNYRDSNQLSIAKIETDHFISKIGEEAVCELYRLFGKACTPPDYAIYRGKKKSWEEDLKVEGKALAVKTQSKSSARRYGLSWTFQDAATRKDPILQDPEAWVCFVGCNDENEHYNCFVYPPYQIKELLFRDPKLAKLKGKKKVLYATDLPNLLH